MKLAEYAAYDATGLAGLVARREVSPTELARTAADAIAALNPKLNAVIELYADRIDSLAESTLLPGPFHGVPFLIKDIGGHLDGRKVEFGSRLCQGLVTTDGDTNLGRMFKEAGLNIIGRSNTPEFSMSGTTENALYGHTATPWREGYSAGGSTGGGAAAVAAGMVPMAHGSDIAGSIRIPASLCGGVGLKPSRGRVSVGPKIDEGGWGLAANFAQTKSIRDTALLLDVMSHPQPGDPFVITKPRETYVTMIGWAAPRLKIGWSVKPLNDRPVDPEIAEAVRRTAKVLASLGHIVEEDHPDYDGEDAAQRMLDVWFFDFPKRIHDLAAKTGRKPGPDTLEPVTLAIYDYAKTISTDQFLTAHASLNTIRRRLGPYFQRHDLWLSPTTAAVAEPWGNYNLGRSDLSPQAYMAHIFRQIQFCFPHNVMGTPAISLPLAMHSSGLPIGVQLGASPGEDHLVLQVAAQLEREMGWEKRVPPLAHGGMQ
jgi:amidase